MNQNAFALILAAGKGTRMKSDRPKVLHTILGEPMLQLVIDALKPLFDQNILIVSGHCAEAVHAAFPQYNFVEQTRQLGTGHALQTALPLLNQKCAELLVINGDAPLITSADIATFLQGAENADLAFATITLDDPASYGRVTRKNGRLCGIVEAKDYDCAKWGDPCGEVNAGIYYINLKTIAPLVSQLQNNNKSGEYYITDLVELALNQRLDVRGVSCGNDANLLGVNSPQELANAENLLARKVAAKLLEQGVMLHAPQLARISPRARIEPGAEIFAPCEIYGETTIASQASIASHCVIVNSSIAAGAIIKPFSSLENAQVGANAQIGPYSRLRPQAEVGANARVGNFVEMKKAKLGEGAKASHLTYLGDAEIGANTNIGAGTITCNYDGVHKHRTQIGENAFIGSNTALVAPVQIGANALIGAGSTITKNVPDNTLSLTRAPQKTLPRRNNGKE